MSHSSRFLAVLGTLGLAAAGACADTTGTGGARPVSLSFSTVSLSPTTSSAARYAVIGAADVLVITKAQLVISKAELERAGVSCVGAMEADEDSCPDLKLGPMLVDLPLDASAKGVLTVNLPAGSYSQFEAKIDAIMSETEGDNTSSAAFLAANPQFRGVSIRVEGTYNGQPFVYTSATEGELELTFTPPLAVDGAANNLTVHVDLASWFRRADGTSINPATATPGSAIKEIVDDNIKRSFDAFEDDDRDGRHD